MVRWEQENIKIFSSTDDDIDKWKTLTKMMRRASLKWLEALSLLPLSLESPQVGGQGGLRQLLGKQLMWKTLYSKYFHILRRKLGRQLSGKLMTGSESSHLPL